jgi:glutamyl-tRNA reductase
MTVLTVGLSHHSAPMETLEAVALDSAGAEALLDRLVAGDEVREVVVLATCNRVEIYAEGGEQATEEMIAGLAAVCGIDPGRLRPDLYIHQGNDAVRHLFLVSCGLDSMLIGEAQIRGQVRDAYTVARRRGSAGPVLHELFQQARRLSKQAESEIGIGRAGASLVDVGLRLAAEHLGTIDGCRALVVGAGAMGALAATALRGQAVADMVIANRTLERAERLAKQVGGRACELTELTLSLRATDIVVSTAASTGTLLTADMFSEHRPVVVLDLCLPRSVEPAVRELDGVELLDLAALGQRLRAEQDELPEESARRLVEAEVEAYQRKARVASATPTIVAMRSNAMEMLKTELNRFHERTPTLSEATRSEVDTMARRLVDKFLHRPMVRVKFMAAAAEDSMYVQVVRDLFTPGTPEAPENGNSGSPDAVFAGQQDQRTPESPENSNRGG